MAEKCSEKIDSEVTIQDRLKQVFEALGITIYQIAKELGENPSKFYNILNGRAKPSYDTIMSLLACYPQISADYLIRGVLPVLNSPEENAMVMATDEDTMEIPFVPVRFYATFVESYTDGIGASDIESFRVRKPVMKGHKQAVVLEISGNSMSPQLAHGAKVLAIPVNENDWVYQSGGVYAVMYRDYFVVKRVRDNELLTRKYLTLHSDNPNGGNVTVPLQDIRGMWKIVTIVEAPVE
ncbi:MULTISPECIES: LexA family transcriptional regulator [Spirosoma]|uniref:LexA family transcriptional regulator n=1 Tax=Spirosoma liriopis TaxID=2937440 RepID=A0ABT0HI28_9BACT|nr:MULTISPECIES: LexA family transcriptional regulator [Spirosoma]MCK8491821.1 LexA family transcriptional regulator [Spirosoma liriopis]UHG91143.1 LexA family transcriptional regulator [Spirosoma oryzicola]